VGQCIRSKRVSGLTWYPDPSERVAVNPTRLWRSSPCLSKSRSEARALRNPFSDAPQVHVQPYVCFAMAVIPSVVVPGWLPAGSDDP
jgi:hypothetical protein